MKVFNGFSDGKVSQLRQKIYVCLGLAAAVGANAANDRQADQVAVRFERELLVSAKARATGKSQEPTVLSWPGT